MENNISKIIGFYNITVVDLSKKSGLSRSTISNIINGGNATKDTMTKIADAIGHGLTVDDIFFAPNVILVVQNVKRNWRAEGARPEIKKHDWLSIFKTIARCEYGKNKYKWSIG